jgi:hypothetical protein
MISDIGILIFEVFSDEAPATSTINSRAERDGLP